MNRVLLLGTLVLTLGTGCAHEVRMAPVALDPINIHCPAECFQACPALEQWVPDPDGFGNWDTLRELAASDAAAIKQCDQRRASCAACIERGQKAGAIR